jgi:hypothetical protein
MLHPVVVRALCVFGCVAASANLYFLFCTCSPQPLSALVGQSPVVKILPVNHLVAIHLPVKFY